MDKKSVVWDVDDVLFGLNETLEDMVKAYVPSYSMSNIKTFNFNRSLTDEMKLELGISLDDKTIGLADRNLIFDIITSVEVYRREQLYTGVLPFFKELCELTNTIIHTASLSTDVMLFKTKQLNSFIKENYLNAGLVVTLLTDVEKESRVFANNGARKLTFTRPKIQKPVLVADFIVEDCLDNLLVYPHSTTKILIDKPYNGLKYNPKFTELCESSNFVRVCNTEEAMSVINKLL